ncbi:two-component system, chemotaxis family, response regulator CheY/two-component system, OmpR family, phosphate regulon response regulator PhoB [Mariprofundus aestuarium]|uniref:Two-component system, chemotaxis family, response regulator CheY/two-component system, OmpR family, phosphate regulon response regulator PhoB n=1 Tax=Mariprofundus aestuarium TaxID=1921086 RepID=A0A2K8L0T2_MARES|nr:response regulator [Mariprofundus aestuarium]ATX80843.1 two-component system, chemotaxis family, response regulator CheY/two-component system, OmpR family, phosphate regulon response regulator PhoB [Mariprofundus aestuarium]
MNILIVDDNPHVTEMLAFLLSSAGYQVNVFEHPELVLSHIKEVDLKPHVLITDYNMPGMNGCQLHQKVVQHVPGINTIVISGRPVGDAVGDLHFIQKPFSPEHIITIIESFSPA